MKIPRENPALRAIFRTSVAAVTYQREKFAD
jgi:hypothetical protein